MAEFFIIKRETCFKCHGKGLIQPKYGLPVACAICINGVNETRVDANEWLLDVLKKLRWTEHNSLRDIRYEELRIEDENSSADDG